MNAPKTIELPHTGYTFACNVKGRISGRDINLYSNFTLKDKDPLKLGMLIEMAIRNCDYHEEIWNDKLIDMLKVDFTHIVIEVSDNYIHPTKPYTVFPLYRKHITIEKSNLDMHLDWLTKLKSEAKLRALKSMRLNKKDFYAEFEKLFMMPMEDYWMSVEFTAKQNGGLYFCLNTFDEFLHYKFGNYELHDMTMASIIKLHYGEAAFKLLYDQIGEFGEVLSNHI